MTLYPKSIYEEVFPYFEKAIYIDRDYADIYYTRARLYRLASKWAETIKDFTKVIDLCPEDWDAYYRRGECYGVWEYSNQEKTNEPEFKGHYITALEDYRSSYELLLKHMAKVQKGEPHFSCEYYDGDNRKINLDDRMGITSKLLIEEISRLENLKKDKIKDDEPKKEKIGNGDGFLSKIKRVFK